MTNAVLDELQAKQQISEVLCRYCRGLDRMDKTLARSVWHEDGTAHYHDMYQGSGYGFVDWVWEAHAPMERHSHQIANSIIQVQGDNASSETYVTVALWTLPDATGEQQEIIGRGRYLDRLSKREGLWAIDHREHILDMQTLNTLSPGYVNAASSRDRTDPSFSYLQPD
jgi:hypothetical protein